MDVMFDENYIKTDLSYDRVETNEYGTDIYIVTVQVGLIDRKYPIYYDLRLRYNQAENFLDISPADGYNEGISAYSEASFVIPDTISEIAQNYVLQNFTYNQC